ncbi:MAG: hypothetical protein OEY61_05995 [Gammaproteobacteria bacterium]|nr:hypothetical protein [Gammaproteobacteria bacterium]
MNKTDKQSARHWILICTFAKNPLMNLSADSPQGFWKNSHLL